MITLQNNNLVMEISEVGAEIHSLYNTQTAVQYVYDGNPTFWARHTPLLFPVTGPLANGTIKAKGSIARPARADYSHQQVINKAGVALSAN